MSTNDLSDFVATPEKKHRSPGTGVIVHCLAWGMAFGLLAFAVPRFEALLTDFGIDLPVLSKLTIKASHFLINYGLVVVPFLMAFLFLDGFVLSTLHRSQEIGKSRAWSALMLGTPLLTIALVLASIILPLINLGSKLSG